MIKSKRGNVEFNELVIPGLIMLVIVLVGAGFYYGFFSSEPLKEIKSEGKSVIDQIVDPIKRDLSAKGSKDPKTNAEEAFDELNTILMNSIVKYPTSSISLKKIKNLNLLYSLRIDVNGKKLLTSLINIESGKREVTKIIEFNKPIILGYLWERPNNGPLLIQVVRELFQKARKLYQVDSLDLVYNQEVLVIKSNKGNWELPTEQGVSVLIFEDNNSIVIEFF